MPDEHRLTIRLPQGALRVTRLVWLARAAIVRQALQKYAARQTGQPRNSDETAVTLAAMAARLDGLQDQVESLATRLESLAASTRQTTADLAASTPAPRGRGHRPGLSHETLAAIAAERRQCAGLSLRAFAM
jgi:hypothetical protein